MTIFDRCVRFPSIEDELQPSSRCKDSLRQALEQQDTATNAALYLLLRAADHFRVANNRFPGTHNRWTRLPEVLQTSRRYIWKSRSSRLPLKILLHNQEKQFGNWTKGQEVS